MPVMLVGMALIQLLQVTELFLSIAIRSLNDDYGPLANFKRLIYFERTLFFFCCVLYILNFQKSNQICLKLQSHNQYFQNRKRYLILLIYYLRSNQIEIELKMSLIYDLNNRIERFILIFKILLVIRLL